MLYRAAIVFVTAAFATACSTFYPSHIQKRDALLLRGDGPDVDPSSVEDYAVAQNQYLAYFANLAGVKGFKGQIQFDKSGSQTGLDKYDLSGIEAADWAAVTEAGVTYIDGQCEDYLHALWELNRAKLATSSEISLIGSLTSAILGATKASTPAIAITASSFGFASSTSDNLYSTLLYQLEPSGVIHLVHDSQNALKANIAAAEKANGITTRNDAVGALHQYIAVCTPQNIEASVNAAVKTAGVTVPSPSQIAGQQSTADGAKQGTATQATQSIGALGTSGVKINAPAPVSPKPNSALNDSTATLSLRNKAVVTQIQNALNKDDPSLKLKVDGLFGPHTLRALSAYQKKDNLPTTSNHASQLDAQTATALGVK